MSKPEREALTLGWFLRESSFVILGAVCWAAFGWRSVVALVAVGCVLWLLKALRPRGPVDVEAD